MVEHVVEGERLLDHHQVELVERAQGGRVVEREGGVGVNHQEYAGKACAHLFDHFPVPARLDLDLDALVAGGQLALDLFEELGGRVLYADGDAASDLRLHAAEVPPQGDAQTLRLQVPAGRLDGGLRHAVAAH